MEKINDEKLDFINGASDQEIRELKEAIFANPLLKRYWDEKKNSGEFNGYRNPELRLLKDVIENGMGENEFVASVNPYMSQNGYWDPEEDGRRYMHDEILKYIREYKG